MEHHTFMCCCHGIHISWEALRFIALLENILSASFALKLEKGQFEIKQMPGTTLLAQKLNLMYRLTPGLPIMHYETLC